MALGYNQYYTKRIAEELVIEKSSTKKADDKVLAKEQNNIKRKKKIRII